MIFERRFTVDAPIAVVADFHRRPATLVRLTPPPIILRLEPARTEEDAGQIVRFVLRIGPISIPWVARITGVSATGFTDTQTAGPFGAWSHRHRFVPLGERATEVVDRVEVTLARDPLRFIIGATMWLSLPLLFAYRAWATARAVGRPGARARPAPIRGVPARIIHTLYHVHPSPKGR